MDVEGMIAAVVEHSAGRPMWVVMRADEEAAGNAVVVPGDVPWLPVTDWDETIIVSQKGKEIRLIAILAKHTGNGALRRLVNGILDAGLVPVVIAPTIIMRDTLKRWNWARRDVGSGWNHEEQWRPRKGWRHA